MGKRLSIEEAKKSLPLPILMASYFLSNHAKRNAFCPFHDDKRQKSFSVFQVGYKWLWKCFAGCGQGDEITFLEKLFRIDNATATKKFVELARDWIAHADQIVQNEIAAGDWPVPESDFDWNRIWEATKEADLIRLGNQRWFSTCFCAWLYKQKQIGFYNGAPCFPVVKDGAVISTHYKEEGSWRYYPLGRGAHPFVLGDLTKAKQVHVLESTWDMLSLADRTEGYLDADTAFIATRGAGNCSLEHQLVKVFVWPQNDKSGREWLKKLLEQYPHAIVMEIPEQFKDVNEMNMAT